MIDEKQRKEEFAVKAKEIIEYCLRSDDPRLDQMVWVQTQKPEYARAECPNRISEPYSVRKAVLATLFDFPDKMNVNTRTVSEDGVVYYEAKNKFYSLEECSPEQQAKMNEEQARLAEVAEVLIGGTDSGTKGKTSISLNLFVEPEFPDLDNIIEWLTNYSARNADNGTRRTTFQEISITKEELARLGIEPEKVFWRETVSKEKDVTISPRDIAEAARTDKTKSSVISRVGKFLEDLERKRLSRMVDKRNQKLEDDRWNHSI